MAAQIIWAPRAVKDLEYLAEFIALDSAFYARYFVKNIFRLVQQLAQFPRSGRIAPEFSKENIRELIYGNYRIVYRVRNKAVEIVTVFHSSKLLKGF